MIDWSDVSFTRHADLQKFYCGKRGKSKPPTATLGPDGQWIMNPVQPFMPPPPPGPGPRGQQANASHPTQEGASAPAPALTLQQYLDKQKQLLSQLSQNQARAVAFPSFPSCTQACRLAFLLVETAVLCIL
jgi:hypothetical protein